MSNWDPIETLEAAERDVPKAIRYELMRVASENGRISYHWLLELYKRGVTDGKAEAGRADPPASPANS